MTEGERQMKIYLKLPEDFSASFNSMLLVANRFEEMTGSDQGVTPFGFVFWLDIYGDFTSKKDVYSKIVNKMFTGMGKDIMSIVPFIEFCQNGYKET